MKPGDPIKIQRTGPPVVRLSKNDCPWLNRPKEPSPVVRLTEHDKARAKHVVVKLGRR